MKSFIQWLENFASHYGGVKNKWQVITAKDVEEDPSIAEELFRLISQAYSKIGGHVSLRAPKDIIDALISGEMSFFKAIDVDEEPDPDALLGFKTRSHGKKAVVSALKPDNAAAKQNWLSYITQIHHSKGYYSEVSEALASVLLKPGIPVIDDEKVVRSILNKDIEWYGKFPAFEEQRLKEREIKQSTIEKFKNFNGWYGRKLDDGNVHVKIMIGIPDIKDYKDADL